MPSDESKGSQLDAIGSLAQRQLDNTCGTYVISKGRSFSSTLLRGWPGGDSVQNFHRGEDEFAGPQLPWLSARRYAIFFLADHNLI